MSPSCDYCFKSRTAEEQRVEYSSRPRVANAVARVKEGMSLVLLGSVMCDTRTQANRPEITSQDEIRVFFSRIKKDQQIDPARALASQLRTHGHR